MSQTLGVDSGFKNQFPASVRLSRENQAENSGSHMGGVVKWVKLASFRPDRKYLNLDHFLKLLSDIYVPPAADFYLAAAANIGSHFYPKAAFTTKFVRGWCVLFGRALFGDQICHQIFDCIVFGRIFILIWPRLMRYIWRPNIWLHSIWPHFHDNLAAVGAGLYLAGRRDKRKLEAKANSGNVSQSPFLDHQCNHYNHFKKDHHHHHK